jgi:putative endonuclease
MKQYYVYIMANGRNGTLYTGVTSDLIKRTYEHRTHARPGFTSQYRAERLVYYEIATEPYVALTREKQIKAWRREWKLKLIEDQNPNWSDLYPIITGARSPSNAR